LTPLINNILSAPSPDSTLLQALAKTSLQPDFTTSLTGAAQLAPLMGQTLSTAESARADALKTSKDLQAQALATAGNIVGGIYGGTLPPVPVRWPRKIERRRTRAALRRILARLRPRRAVDRPAQVVAGGDAGGAGGTGTGGTGGGG